MNTTVDGAYFITTVTLKTTDSPRLQKLTEKELLIIWITFGMIWSCGLIANLFLVVALGKTKQTPFNVIIIGLCCSDIMSAIASPFIVGQIMYSNAKKAYPWNAVICKTAIPIGSVTGAVTIQLVFTLSVWRLHAIHWPHKTIGFMTLRRAKLIVISTWMISTVLLLPLAAYYLNVVPSTVDHGKLICFTSEEAIWIAHVYHFVDAVILNLIPIIWILMLCVATVFYLLRRKTKRQGLTGDHKFRREEKQALFQLSLIIASFLIGYLPKFFLIISYIVGHNRRVTTISYLVSRGLLNTTECINPIIYSLSSDDIRSSLKHSFQRLFCTSRHRPEEKRSGDRTETECDV